MGKYQNKELDCNHLKLTMHIWETAERKQHSSTHTLQALTNTLQSNTSMYVGIEARSTDNAVIYPTIRVVSHRHRQKLDWRQHWETPNHTNHPVSDQIINETMRWSSILGAMAWSTVLSNLINIKWKTGQLPTDWKTAVLIPLLKKNKAKSDHPAKKPTSLTSYIGTLVERIIIELLNLWLEHNNIITPCHTGFRSSYTTAQKTNWIYLHRKFKMDSKWTKTRLPSLFIWTSLMTKSGGKDSS